MIVHCGNISFLASEAEIRTLFEKYGAVESVTLPVYRDSGRVRGFAFIEMADADAAKAIEALNGREFAGRELKVSPARPRNER